MVTDLRYAVRQLLKSPGFAAVAITTLALSIGASTAIFSVLNGVLLRPLAYPEPDRLVVVMETQLPQYPKFSVSPANFIEWQRQAKSFEHLAAYTETAFNLTGEHEPQRLLGQRVTAYFFNVYGVPAALGRTFFPEEDAVGKNHVVVLSHSCWQRVFGGATDVLGRALQLNGEPYTVIGVTQPAQVADNVDTWVPMAFTPDELSQDNRGLHWLEVVGRLKRGIPVEQADAELKLVAAQLGKHYPDSNKGWSVFVKPLLDYIVRDVRPALFTLLGAIACVLLIACANIANLLLARATARHREISIRAAVGATRGRLLRQFLTESLLLALLGGLVGVMLAHWGLAAVLALAPADLPRMANIHLDQRVFAFSFGLTVITSLLFGIAPAWLAARTDANEVLKQGARGSTDSSRRGRVRGSLIVLEVTLALMLLASAGLLTRSFVQLARVNLGFTPQNVTVLRLVLPEEKYATPEQQIAFTEALIARLRALPGVAAAGIAEPLPFRQGSVFLFNIESRSPIAVSELPSTYYYAVTPDYFRAIDLKLLRGRLFTAHDDERAPRIAIINQTLARRYFSNDNPIGKRINLSNGSDTWREIVGVVADVKQSGVDKATACQTYEPFAQNPFRTVNVVLRTIASPAALLGALRPMIYAIDKDQPLGTIRPLEDIVADSIAAQRFAMLLLTVFSIVALVISTIGIYGVMAYSVAQRTSEFGIRIALGAKRSDLLRLVLGEGGKLIGLGLLIGLAGTFAASRLVTSMLFQTSEHDPVTLTAVTLLLGGVAVLACLVPSYRATKVNPMEALRAE